MLNQANKPSRYGQLEHPFGHSNSYKQHFHNLRGRQSAWCPTHRNTVGKVKNIKLYNFCLISFTTLYAAISLEVTWIWSHTLPFSSGTMKIYLRNTSNTDVQLLGASSNCIPLLKTFCKWIAMAVLSLSAACRTNCNHMTSCHVQSFPWICTVHVGFCWPRP